MSVLSSLPARTAVLVAGGGPVGLATAIELAQRGIECLVVEPRREVSRMRPRCKTVNVRSMEHLRRWGIADRLRELAPLPVEWSQDIVFCTSLTGWELSRFRGALGLVHEGDRFAERGQQVPQYVLEELLRDVVGELPCSTFAPHLHVTGLEQDDDEVRVTVADEDGATATVVADYVVGCDGPRSVVREAIGGQYVGEHALRPNFGMVFHSQEISERVQHGPAVQYWILNPDAPALMGPIDRTGTWWLIAFDVDRETGVREAQRIIDAAVGAPVQAAVLSHDPWTARMQLVDHLRRGRVFLAGDAAHLNPPFGGHGLNTGLGDGVDLGWKLAAVVAGWGGPALLESYEAERRPVQTAVIAAATANMRFLAGDLLADGIATAGPTGDDARRLTHDRIQATKRAEFHALDLVLDVAYAESPVIVAEDAGQSAAAHVGRRLAHAWLEPGRSLYDALGSGLTLLVLSDGAASDAEAVLAAGAARRVPMSLIDLSGRDLRKRYGADLVLVRPDGHVAWAGDRCPQDPIELIDRLRGTVPVAAC